MVRNPCNTGDLRDTAISYNMNLTQINYKEKTIKSGKFPHWIFEYINKLLLNFYMC